MNILAAYILKYTTRRLQPSWPNLSPDSYQKGEKEELDNEVFISKPPASTPRQAALRAMAWPYLSAQAWSCVSN